MAAGHIYRGQSKALARVLVEASALWLTAATNATALDVISAMVSRLVAVAGVALWTFAIPAVIGPPGAPGVTDTTAPSFLIVWPAGIPQPLASNLNWTVGKTVPNLVEVAVGAGGQISFYNGFGTVDVVLDMEGYVGVPTAVPPPAGLYNPVVPNRVLDTRLGMGAPAAQVCAGQTISVKIAGTPGVPSTGVAAVVLNVTVTRTVVAPSSLTVYPTGTGRPLTSNLNFVPGQTLANGVIVKLGTGGYVDFYDAAGHTGRNQFERRQSLRGFEPDAPAGHAHHASGRAEHDTCSRRGRQWGSADHGFRCTTYRSRAEHHRDRHNCPQLSNFVAGRHESAAGLGHQLGRW